MCSYIVKFLCRFGLVCGLVRLYDDCLVDGEHDAWDRAEHEQGRAAAGTSIQKVESEDEEINYKEE